MKFLTKINRRYLITLTSILIIISIAGYFILNIVLENELQEDISEQEYAIIREIKTSGNLPNIYPNIESRRIAKNDLNGKAVKKIWLMDKAEGETEPFMEYSNSLEINHKYYLIIIRHSMVDKQDLILAIALPLIALLTIALIISYFTSRKLNKSVWKDFERNLYEIENFRLSNNMPLKLKSSNIEEFERLNGVINKMGEKLNKEYSSLKEFTENASHEIQTPISIALLNLEELLQSGLNEQSMKQVVSAINSLKRLSSLNQSLILLTKIENKQFGQESEIDIGEIINSKKEELLPMLESKKIKVKLMAINRFKANIDPRLADILIGNLMLNAIKHNVSNGTIEIEIQADEFKICNSGNDNPFSNKDIFNRFTKNKAESFGLGLAIAKKICETNNLEIGYSKNHLHCFVIKHAL
ncbi:MAG: HAMP domain-containing histidine kinase [Chlorobi bacterium]|nr:HAMP domain-containing histidine kinase [Chlorobiota bacterium]